MDANTELNAAVDKRIGEENRFKGEIIRQINIIIDQLEYCDPTNAASTLDLSQDQLRQVIERLNDTREIFGDSESIRIADTLNGKNLRRGLDGAPPVPASVAPSAPTAPTYAAAVTNGRRQAPAVAPAAPGIFGNILNAATNLATATSPPPAGYVRPKRGGRKTRRRRQTRR
jgi:hypothetical protein